MVVRKKPASKRIRKLLDYNPDTGVLTWKRSPNPSIKAGSVAGATHINGYVYIGVDRKSYRAHRMAFVCMTGKWPKCQVDHRDRHKDNNRWDNLRESNNTQNQGNAGIRKNNTSGHPGVSWQSDCDRWRVKAIEAHKKAHKKAYGEFSNIEGGIW